MSIENLTGVLETLASDEAQRLLYALTQHARIRAEFAESCGMPQSDIEDQLGRLLRVGLLVREQGSYKVASHVRVSETADEVLLEIRLQDDSCLRIGRPRAFFAPSR